MPARMSGRLDHSAVERCRPADHGAVRIAEHDAGAHPDQLVDEEEPRLEHLLVDEQHARCIASRPRSRSTSRRRERPARGRLRAWARGRRGRAGSAAPARHRPRGVSPSMRGRMPSRSKPSSVLRRSSGRTPSMASWPLVTAASPMNERDLDVVGADFARCPVQRVAALDDVGVAADALDVRAHGHQGPRRVLHMRFGGGVSEGGPPRGGDRRHQGVLGAGDARLVEEDVGADEVLRRRSRIARRP